MESTLRPRDIQARIRSGESPESVAAAASTTVDRIMGFAAPVLAERAYVAQQAQKASVRRRAGDGPIGQLGDAVARRLTERDVDPDSVEWDAWRREDGRWTLVADYSAAGGEQRAQFVFDMAGRYVVADDDESRRLVGERAAGRGPAGSAGPVDDPAQAALGDDAIALVTGRPLAAVVDPDELEAADVVREDDEDDADAEDAEVGAHDEAPADHEVGDADETDDLSVVAREFRPAGPAPATRPDWIATQATDRPAPVVPPAPAPEQAPRREPEHASDQGALFEVAPAPAEVSEPGGEESAEESDEGAAARTAEPEQPTKGRRSARPKGRASVPSWDEIMFGSAKNE